MDISSERCTLRSFAKNSRSWYFSDGVIFRNGIARSHGAIIVTLILDPRAFLSYLAARAKSRKTRARCTRDPVVDRHDSALVSSRYQSGVESINRSYRGRRLAITR